MGGDVEGEEGNAVEEESEEENEGEWAEDMPEDEEEDVKDPGVTSDCEAEWVMPTPPPPPR